MDLLTRRPAPRAPRAASFLRALLLLLPLLPLASCEREFDNPYLPDSEGYAGSDWSRDGDGDGVADSVEKYAPGCGDGPAACLAKARANAKGSGEIVDLEAVTVEDMAILEGGPGMPPRPRWTPAHVDIVFTFASDDPSVADAADSLVVPRAVGTAWFTLTARNARGGAARSARFRVTVTRTRVGVTGITAEDLRLAPGEVQAPRVTVLPLDATDRRYELLTHDPRVVTVRDGLLAAGESGTTLVTARALDGGHEALFRVTVEAAVQSVTASALVMQVGVEPQAPTLAFVPANATDKTYRLTGGDPSVAVPTEDGQRVRAVGAGTTWITVTVAGGLTASFTVTVEKAFVAVRGVRVKEMSFRLLTSLDPRLKSPEITWTPEDATNKGYTLVSEDERIARIVGDQVEAVRSGETKVTLTTWDGAKRATFKVKVAFVFGCPLLEDCEED